MNTKWKYYCGLSALFFASTYVCFADDIATIAGNGTKGYSGDGGAATNANLNIPLGVAFDKVGNLYIGDNNNHRIRKIGTNGIITTVAGNGIASYSGDGGAATNASINYPWGVTLDNVGNVYIADQINNRIRKVGTNGIITTVAGNGTKGYSGDGGAATNANLNIPLGVAFDKVGNLYIGDNNNHRIRKVGTNGIITTVAGNGIASYSGDGGAATNAGINYPIGVAIDAAGNLCIADQINNRIRKVGTNGIITTVAGNGTKGYSGDDGAATNANINNPVDVALDCAGNLYIGDNNNHRIRKVGTNGIITTVAGNGIASYSGDGGAATNAGINYPIGVAIDAAGNLCIADQINNRIRKVFMMPVDPMLRILINVSNQPVIYFPTSTCTNLELQMITDLNSGTWMPVTNDIPTSGYIVTNASAAAFFRVIIRR